MGATRYLRRRPVGEVEAMEVTDRNGAEIEAWCGAESYDVAMAPGQTHHVDIQTTAGKVRCGVGDYVVRTQFGDLRRFTAKQFEKQYEAAPPHHGGRR